MLSFLCLIAFLYGQKTAETFFNISSFVFHKGEESHAGLEQIRMSNW